MAGVPDLLENRSAETAHEHGDNHKGDASRDEDANPVHEFPWVRCPSLKFLLLVVDLFKGRLQLVEFHLLKEIFGFH